MTQRIVRFSQPIVSYEPINELIWDAIFSLETEVGVECPNCLRIAGELRHLARLNQLKPKEE